MKAITSLCKQCKAHAVTLRMGDNNVLALCKECGSFDIELNVLEVVGLGDNVCPRCTPTNIAFTENLQAVFGDNLCEVCKEMGLSLTIDTGFIFKNKESNDDYDNDDDNLTD